MADEVPAFLQTHSHTSSSASGGAIPHAAARLLAGAGLGLSIVDSLVRAHGGSVAVASTPGRGTAFTLRLPLAPVEVEALAG